jgi:hypothetical protein
MTRPLTENGRANQKFTDWGGNFLLEMWKKAGKKYPNS